MQFNGDEFEFIRYWSNQDLGSAFKAEFKYINESGKEIEEKEDIKDLGIQLAGS